MWPLEENYRHMKYRDLTASEILQLKKNSCLCSDWSRVKVKTNFTADNIRNVTFSGDIFIGTLKKQFYLEGGVPKTSGIYNATIHNCRIDDDVYISQIKNHLANYHIKEGVRIENVDSLVVTQKTSFGNGIRVAVLNETGGREIAITNNLSGHTAYLMAFYRHRPILIDRLMNMADEYASSIASDMGTIDKNAHILNCQTIENVYVGADAKVEGIYRLSNGSINSCPKDPTFVGPGVLAEDFIFLEGSHISESVMISKCFVGQSCVLGKQYSAENSVFFANCQGFHGEACSIFAGPFTVSHHKSSLLIAGYYSFLNAGSGSNQSNHMYKLGPIHQGIVERGSKTTSDSYILWPAKIGAFSLVMGRHYHNPDTSDLPFSYLIENSDESYLAPAVNLRSIGTIRDARKWPKRDRRKSDNQPDQIIFNLLSPYSIEKIIRGIHILNELANTCGPASDHFMYNGVKIEAKARIRALHLYHLAMIKFLGNALVKKLETGQFTNQAEMYAAMNNSGDDGNKDWIDMAGLITPKEKIKQLVEEIENTKIKGLDELNDIYKGWKDNYFDWAWNWIVLHLQTEVGLDVKSASVQEIIAFVEEWKAAVISLDKMMYEDAKKEFSLQAQTSFGIDGSDDIKILDFENVRGKFASHPAVMEIMEHIELKSNKAKYVLTKLKNILQ
jgi:hypothetical protein